MDEEDFIEFLHSEKKSERSINRYLRGLKFFSNHLVERGLTLDTFSKSDLHSFKEANLSYKTLPQVFWAIRSYLKYVSNQDLFNATREIIGQLYLKDYRIAELAENKELARSFQRINIRTAEQLLYSGLSVVDREELADLTDLSYEEVTKLVKLANLARIPGIKRIRGKLFYEAGLDTLTKIASFDSAESLQSFLITFIEQSNFEASPPLSSEAFLSYTLAKYLPKIFVS
ncbi:MAG: DUF4332 domain-containing protein [Candidatus Kariarchaeaceae archaeon]